MLQVKRQTNGNGSGGGHGHFGAPTSAGRNGKKKSRKLDKAYFPVKMSLHARQKRPIFGVWCDFMLESFQEETIDVIANLWRS